MSEIADAATTAAQLCVLVQWDYLDLWLGKAWC